MRAWLDHGVGLGGARSYLRKVQAKLCWVPREAIELASEHYQVPFSALFEEVAFNTYFSLEEQGERILEVCMGSACRDGGSQHLMGDLEALTRLRVGQTSADGALTLKSTFCQGRCAVGPNVRVRGGEAGDLELHGQTPDQAKALVERTKKSPEPAEKPFN
jgi:NADH-quinone oxidoreductase subunit E